MPGNIKHTAGANPQPNNFGRTISSKKIKAMKEFEKSFGRAYGKPTKGNLKTWEDRNRAIKGTKLSK